MEESRVATSRVFSTCGHPLEMVTPFKKLGRVLSAEDDDWPAVSQNLEKAQTVWRKISRILRREEARPPVYRFSSKLSPSRCCY